MKISVVALVAAPMLCFGLTIGGATGVASAGTPIPGAPNCPVFPADNVWNTPVNNLPVSPYSAEWLAAMDASTTNLQFVWGPPYGMPITVVSPSQPLVNITFASSGNDPGPYPFSADTGIEGGADATGDRHAIMINPSTCTDYELYKAYYSASGSTADNGAIYNLNSDALRPHNLATVDASGLPLVAGIARYDELEDGAITHAIRVQAVDTDTQYIWPATAGEGSADNPDLPPMGARFRLSASFNISTYSPQVQVVLRALQTYGLILADNGPNWHFWGDNSDSWPLAVVQALKTVPGSAFQAVDESSLEISPNSGQARQLGVAVNCTSSQTGYRMVASDGGLFSFCETFLGSMGGQHLNAPIVAMASTQGGNGYWEVGSDGGIFNFGNAGFYGSTGSMHLNAPIVGMAATHDGGGYWLVASDGGIFNYGDAGFYGSAGSLHLNKPIVGMAATPDGKGYWLVASDGGIFSYGDAQFYGSVGAIHLNKPVVGMATTSDGGGYWLVASDGGIFNYGDAGFDGSAGAIPLNKPIVGMEADSTGGGYWLVASDGGIFNYGNAGFYGSTGGTVLNAPIVGMG
jgi:hypothetical protein